eukprot:4395040-Prymnesium_polylepis.1
MLLPRAHRHDERARGRPLDSAVRGERPAAAALSQGRLRRRRLRERRQRLPAARAPQHVAGH